MSHTDEMQSSGFIIATILNGMVGLGRKGRQNMCYEGEITRSIEDILIIIRFATSPPQKVSQCVRGIQANQITMRSIIHK